MNITEPIRQGATHYPDRPALIAQDGTAVSYRALDGAVDHMAGVAAATGLRPGDTAGLTIRGPDERISLILALALARCGIASAEPSLPPGQLTATFEPSDHPAPGNIGFGPAWMRSPGETARAPMHPGGAAVCRIVASSGTTGRPKHIPLSHDVIARRIAARDARFGAGAAVRVIGVGLGSSSGWDTALRTLWGGGTIVLTNPVDAPAAMRRHGVTEMLLSAHALRQMLDTLPPDDPGFPALRQIEIVGSAVPDALWRAAVERLCVNVHNRLGAAETGGIASARFADIAGRPGAIGTLYPGVVIQTLDAAGAVLPPGEPGVLRLSTPWLADGYVEADQPGFDAGWFTSGDLGFIAADGVLTITGRQDEAINVGGVKIDPVMIEDALLRLPLVTEAAAFGLPTADGLMRIGAAIVARTRIDDAVLNAFCAHALPGFAPSVILQMPALPRNANGKVLRRELARMAG